MTNYLIRRIGTSVVVVVGVSAVTFLLLHMVFPSPARIVLSTRASAAELAAWNREHGFDDPWFIQYWHYVYQLLHGNLGYAYKYNQNVTALFAERWSRSAYLSGASLVLSVLIAFPLGIFQAVRRNTAGDNLLTGTAFVFYAMPVFFLGVILIQIFALSFPVLGFEASQSTSLWSVLLDWRDMTLPIATLTLIEVASFSRYMRSSAIDVLAQDYIKVARAKGLPERLVLLRHLARNACLPMVTLIGLSIPALLAGNLIVETLFNFQGLGLLFYNALNQEDYGILLAYTLFGAVLTVAGNLLADVALTVADPRIRLT